MKLTRQETEKRKHARRVITKIVNDLCGVYNLEFNRIAIKNTRSRLGSCSSKMNLNFNWQITKFPREYLEYVVKHEVAHLKHQNHSKDFWSFLARLDPEYKKHHKWIKNNSPKVLKF